MKGKTFLLASAVAVMVAVSSAPASAGAWWENTKISGRMYYDMTSIDHQRWNIDQTDNGFSFDIKRFYVGIDHKFNDVFSANVTTDFKYDGGAGATQVYIKKAYLEANLSPMLDIRLGSTDLPWVPFVEGINGYRYVEHVLIDRVKFGTSADWGVHFKGKFANGILQYAVSIVNGNGYKKPLRADGVDVEGRLSAHWKGITLAVGGYEGHLGAAHGTTTYHDATRFDALAAYTGHGFRVGFEYFQANNWMTVTSPVADDSDGYSMFASYQFTPEWGVFGRYDWVNPSNKIHPNLQEEFYNFGVSYTPYKMIDFALVYKHDKADHGYLATENGTIGGYAFVPGPIGEGTYDEVGLFGRLRW